MCAHLRGGGGGGHPVGSKFLGVRDLNNESYFF